MILVKMKTSYVHENTFLKLNHTYKLPDSVAKTLINSNQALLVERYGNKDRKKETKDSDN